MVNATLSLKARRLHRTLIIFFTLTIFFTLITGGQLATADTMKSFKSQPSTTILELYTSQGCYSCPPAEKWINTLTSHPKLWKELIPINLHVDYWDYLGWKDPFARKTFSHRQRVYQRLGHTHNVATPGFVVNGKGWNGWFYGRDIPESQNEFGNASLNVDLSSNQASIDFTTQKDTLPPIAHISILGFGTKTKIPKGENAGKILEHDFVVVGYKQARLVRNEDQWTITTDLPKTVNETMDRQALTVWISTRNDPSPLQAVGGWL